MSGGWRLHWQQVADPRGTAFVDVLAAIALFGLLAGMALPTTLRATHRQRAIAAARWVAAAIDAARLAAMTRGERTGLAFTQQAGGPVLELVEDGDGDGITTDDRRLGVDTVIARLADFAQFSKVGLCIAGTLSAPGSPETLHAWDAAVRVGTDHTLRFSPEGQGSSGTVYICTADGSQAAVRTFGATGRVRVLLRQADGAWEAI